VGSLFFAATSRDTRLTAEPGHVPPRGTPIVLRFERFFILLITMSLRVFIVISLLYLFRNITLQWDIFSVYRFLVYSLGVLSFFFGYGSGVMGRVIAAPGSSTP
jgi:small-conductance mechanosensitive channel